MPSGGRLYIYTVIRFRPECLTRSGRLSTGSNRYRVKQFCVGFTHFCADLIKYLILRVYCICILYTVYYTVIPKRPRPIRQRNRALFNPRTVRLHYYVIITKFDFIQSHCSFYFVSKNRHFFQSFTVQLHPLINKPNQSGTSVPPAVLQMQNFVPIALSGNFFVY